MSMTSVSVAQTFTYSFEAANGSAWPADWSGASFSDEGHHNNGWGFDNPGSATDDYTGAYVGDQSANVSGAKYHNKSYDVTKSSLNYTMSWNPNGFKGLVDNVAAGKSPENQIMQIGLFSATPGRNNSRFGTDVVTSAAGQDSIYLAGVELSSNSSTQQGSLSLRYYDEAGSLLANFGTLNYTAVEATGAHLFNFRQDFVDLNNGDLQITLTMDEYIVNPGTNSTTLVGQTSFGTQNVTHNLNSLTTITPGLGIRVHDFANTGITAANYDGGVPVVVPEPSSIMLTMLGSLGFILRRRR